MRGNKTSQICEWFIIIACTAYTILLYVHNKGILGDEGETKRARYVSVLIHSMPINALR